MKVLIHLDVPLGMSNEEAAERVKASLLENLEPDWAPEDLDEFDVLDAEGNKMGTWRARS